MTDVPEVTIEPMYAFDVWHDGTATPTDPAEYDLAPPPTLAYRWIHLDLNEGDVRGWLAQSFDETIADALTPKDTRPRATRHAGGILLNLRGVNTNPEDEPEDMVSIRMWIEDRRIVSVRLRRLAAIVSIIDRIKADKAPVNQGDFLIDLIEGLLERAEPVISAVSEGIDELEEAGLSKPQEIRDALSKIRHDAVVFRRFFAPQRDALNSLAQIAPNFFDADARSALNQAIDRSVRMVEELDAVRERGLVLNDQLTNLIGERMNRIMMVLSVVAAIFLPLTFLTGLLGINVGGIPGAESPYAFPIVVASMTAIGACLILWFRSRDWL